MKNILVTGGMGFIGKVLCRKLSTDVDNSVLVVDNLSSSKADRALMQKPNIHFILGDCLEFFKKPRDYKFDEVYHLASPVGPVGVLNHKGEIAKMVIDDLYEAAMFSIRHGAKLLFISTSEVYGRDPDNRYNGQFEDIDKVVPSIYTVRLEYGVAKLLGEIMLSNLKRAYPEFRYNAIRPFNIVGPEQNAGLGFVIPRFLEQARKGEPLTVYGDGSMVRTFTHVEDFVDGIMAVMNSDIVGEVFNVGNPANVCSIKELAARIIAELSTPEFQPTMTMIDPRELHGKDFAEAWNKIPNIEKITAMTSWTPKINLDDTINDIIRKDWGDPC